jgi:hypothetical protein
MAEPIVRLEAIAEAFAMDEIDLAEYEREKLPAAWRAVDQIRNTRRA